MKAQRNKGLDLVLVDGSLFPAFVEITKKIIFVQQIRF